MPNPLSHYLAQWQLANPELIAQTATSNVYQVQYQSDYDQTVVLKLLTPIGEKDESQGAVALAYFNGQGAVHLLKADQQAHLLEYLDGNDLTALSTQGQDEQATLIMADVLNQLHSVACPSEQTALVPLKTWFSALFQQTDQHPLFATGAQVAEQLLNHPLDCHILHGDIHHANIRHHQTRGWLAFDPKGLIGERTFDCANILCNPTYEVAVNEGRLLKTSRILAEKTGIDHARVLAFGFAYACLSACWSFEDGDDPTLALEIAEIIHQHL